eukprot:2567610-Prymnesium_polylepis.1
MSWSGEIYICWSGETRGVARSHRRALVLATHNVHRPAIDPMPAATSFQRDARAKVVRSDLT